MKTFELTPIKLFEIPSNSDNVRRFQSQLSLGRDTASHIIKNEILYEWGARGSWVEVKQPYEIVKSVSDMKYQTL